MPRPTLDLERDVTYTRVDNLALIAALDGLRRHLTAARAALAPLLVTNLTEGERASTLRAPDKAAEATRTLAEVAHLRPQLTAAAEFDRDAVLEDVANSEALAGLAEQCAELARWIADSKLVWESEYYRQSLALHQLAKARVSQDGSLEPLVAPFGRLFASRKRPVRDAEPPATEPAEPDASS